MASLNLSTNGPSIKSSYQGVVNGQLAKSDSPTYALWALFTVQAPLMNAFQGGGSSESVLKVETKGGKLHPAWLLFLSIWRLRRLRATLTLLVRQMASLPI